MNSHDEEAQESLRYAMHAEALQDQKSVVAEMMVVYGGSFERGLGMALAHSDLRNTILIKKTWPECWNQYLRMSEVHKLPGREVFP